MKVIFIDIDNTLLSFDGYVKEGMKKGFKEFGLKDYEPWMYDVFKAENDRLWCMIEKKELTFEELIKIRWNIIFKRLGIDSDGPTFETYFRSRLNESAIPVDGAMEMLKELKASGKYILAAASNGPYDQQVHRLEISGMDKYFEYMFISEKMGCSKPAKEFLEKALEEINESPARAAGDKGCESGDDGCKSGGNDGCRKGRITAADCVMLGDSVTSDMAGGRNAGMHTCYFRRDKSDNITDDADIVVDDLRDVPKAICGIWPGL